MMPGPSIAAVIFCDFSQASLGPGFVSGGLELFLKMGFNLLTFYRVKGFKFFCGQCKCRIIFNELIYSKVSGV